MEKKKANAAPRFPKTTAKDTPNITKKNDNRGRASVKIGIKLSNAHAPKMLTDCKSRSIKYSEKQRNKSTINSAMTKPLILKNPGDFSLPMKKTKY